MRVSSKVALLTAFRLLGFTLAAAGSCALAQIPDPGSEGKLRLPWLKEYADALQEARADKKPLLVDITTDWCGWSKKMERETFADLAVQKELRSFVLIRINPETSEKNQKVAESYGADSYPTLVIANYKGEQIGTESGYANAKDFLEFLHRYQPLFKGNPLGYKSVQLDPSDPLMKAIQKIPPPESRPTDVGSFIVLDQCSIQLQPNGAAKFFTRTATFVSDPEKPGQPDASGHYVSSRQKLKFKTVRILDTKGAGREVDVKLAKDEHAYSNQNVYWDARTLSLDLPTLKEGQILDVIDEREFQPIMPGQFYFRWNTGLKILLASDLTITFPASLKLERRSIRCKGQVQETKNPDGTITWRLATSNRKPYEPALFSPPIHEIWEGYDFYTPCTKEAVAAWFSGLCQGRDTLPASATQRIASLKRADSRQAALLQAILDWVTKDIRYVSVAFGASSHQPHPVGDTLANLYGDCKDQSLLVQALCRQAGIPASIVLLNAYGEDFDAECPAIERFNHCIVQASVDDHAYYLDPAAGPSKPGQVPPDYAGVRALRLDGAIGQSVTLPLYQPQPDEGSSQTLVKLNPNGSASITETMLLTGQAALQMKERMKNTPPEKTRKYLEASYKKAGSKLLDFYMTDTNAPGDKYESRISYTAPRFGSRTAGGIAFKMGSGREDTWIDSLDLPRTQAFRFRASDASQLTYIVELPPGAVLKGQPDGLQIKTPFMQAARKVLFQDNKLSVSESSRFLDARLEASESRNVYNAFRQLRDHRQYTYVVELPPERPAPGE